MTGPAYFLQYLGAKHAQGTWYPTDLKRRSRAVQWMDWALSTYFVAARPVFLDLTRAPAEKRDMAAIGKARDVWSKAVAILDNHLAGSRYVAGDTITIGDMPVAIDVSMVRAADRARELSKSKAVVRRNRNVHYFFL